MAKMSINRLQLFRITPATRGLNQKDAGHTLFFYTGHVRMHTKLSQVSLLLRSSQYSYVEKKTMQNLLIKVHGLVDGKKILKEK